MKAPPPFENLDAHSFGAIYAAEFARADDLNSFGRRPSRPSVNKVVRYIRECLISGVTEADVLYGRRRTRAISGVRWAVIARLRADGYSLLGIANRFNMDHTSVIHALRQVANGRQPYSGYSSRSPHQKKAPRSHIKYKPVPLIRYAGYDRRERLKGLGDES